MRQDPFLAEGGPAAPDLETAPKPIREAPAPPGGGRRRLFAWITLAAVLIAALAAGGYYLWQAYFSGVGRPERLTTAAVQRGDLEDAITATGTLQPRDFVDVGTQVSGQLKTLHVEIGSIVKQGELLAEIDPTVYQSRVDADRAQLRNQEAQLADKQSQLELANQQLSRQRNLMREEATTAEQLQQAEASVRSITAQIAALRAQMQQTGSSLRGNEANLGYTKIYAPMSGTVVSMPAKKGQTLNANQQAPIILRIADLSVMTVQAQVSEADVPRLRLGMEVYFTTLGSEGKRWFGKLRQVNPTPTVVNNVVLYDALFDVPNSRQELMTQMTAQVFFVAASAKDAVYVPLSALRPVSGEGRRNGAGAPGPGGRSAATRPSEGAGIDPRAVFASGRAVVRVVAEDGTASEREVQLGMMTRVLAQIVAGLEPGEQVVVGVRGQGASRGAQSGQSGPRFTPRL